MRRFSLAALALSLIVSLTSLSGCGTDNSVGDIQESDAAKNANKASIDAMRGAMQSKSTGPSKGGTKGAAAAPTSTASPAAPK